MSVLFEEWNIALGKLASQSSVYSYPIFYDYEYTFQPLGNFEAEKAIDNCAIRSLQQTFCCSATEPENKPWWMVDLGTFYPIGKIVIHRRSEEPNHCKFISDFRGKICHLGLSL